MLIPVDVLTKALGLTIVGLVVRFVGDKYRQEREQKRKASHDKSCQR